jgi:hypothetical protein
MFYRPDAIDRGRSSRSIYFHGSIKTCIDRHKKATIVYYSIILFDSNINLRFRLFHPAVLLGNVKNKNQALMCIYGYDHC